MSLLFFSHAWTFLFTHNFDARPSSVFALLVVNMSSLYIQGFFALNNGHRETLPRTPSLKIDEPDLLHYYCHYTTTIRCSADGSCIRYVLELRTTIDQSPTNSTLCSYN